MKAENGKLKAEDGKVTGDVVVAGMKSESGKTKVENGRVKGDLKKRTKEFALKIVRLYSDLPRRREAQVIGDQLLRSGTSVGAHFREAQRAKSNPDFISKLEGATFSIAKPDFCSKIGYFAPSPAFNRIAA